VVAVVGTLLALAPIRPAAAAPPAPAVPFVAKLPALPAPAFFSYDAADALLPGVDAFTAPDATGQLIHTFTNPTKEGYPLTFLVRQAQGDWLQVLLPARPNGTIGWIHRSDVNLRPVANRIVVELAARRITVFHGAQQLFQTTVAIGKDSTPTPAGDFYVDVITHQGGAYGAALLSVTGFSDVLQHFGGGIGQIAIHGTNQPSLIGQAVSHGCVRLHNEDILQVEALAPTGTPVTILP
jgi:lipoprotein-anchoring transpeptidase ErfK/SrfK